MPADARLLEAKDSHVRESTLTRESLPVEKDVLDFGARSRPGFRAPGTFRVVNVASLPVKVRA